MMLGQDIFTKSLGDMQRIKSRSDPLQSWQFANFDLNIIML